MVTTRWAGCRSRGSTSSRSVATGIGAGATGATSIGTTEGPALAVAHLVPTEAAPGAVGALDAVEEGAGARHEPGDGRHVGHVLPVEAILVDERRR